MCDLWPMTYLSRSMCEHFYDFSNMFVRVTCPWWFTTTREGEGLTVYGKKNPKKLAQLYLAFTRPHINLSVGAHFKRKYLFS